MHSNTNVNVHMYMYLYFHPNHALKQLSFYTKTKITYFSTGSTIINGFIEYMYTLY